MGAAAVKSLLPPPTMASALKPEDVDRHPPFVWPLLQQVLSVQECFQDQQYGEWRALAADRCLGLGRGKAAAKAGSHLRSEVRAALQAKSETAVDKVSRVAGRARMPVDVALASRRMALDAECQALTVYDVEVGRRMPNGAAQLRRLSLDREDWTYRLLPLALFSAEKAQVALQELLS